MTQAQPTMKDQKYSRKSWRRDFAGSTPYAKTVDNTSSNFFFGTICFPLLQAAKFFVLLAGTRRVLDTHHLHTFELDNRQKRIIHYGVMPQPVQNEARITKKSLEGPQRSRRGGFSSRWGANGPPTGILLFVLIRTTLV